MRAVFSSRFRPRMASTSLMALLGRPSLTNLDAIRLQAIKHGQPDIIRPTGKLLRGGAIKGRCQILGRPDLNHRIQLKAWRLAHAFIPNVERRRAVLRGECLAHYVARSFASFNNWVKQYAVTGGAFLQLC